MSKELKVLSDGSECVPYNAGEYPVYAGEAWLHSYAGMSLGYHWHDDIEFGLVKNGRISYSINGEILSLNENEGIFINARQMHGNFSEDGSDGEYRCVLIHPSLLCGKYPTIDQKVRDLVRNDSWAYQRLKNDVSWQGGLMREICALYDAITDGDDFSAFGIMSLSFSIVRTLSRHMPKASDGLPPADKRIPELRNMVGFIQMRYAEKISVKDICVAGNIGTSTCYDLFSRHFGLTPLEYLTRYRLFKAVERLANRNISVTETAYSTGFSSASYFCECFKKQFSITPTQYRNQADAY